MPNIDYSSQVADILKRKKEIAAPNGNIALWGKWYKGKVPSFHSYTVFNGQKKQRCQRLTMHMAKQACEDWASLLMNEKVEFVVSSKEKMEKLLLKLDFWTKANEAVEKGWALSLSALVVELDKLEVEINEETGEGTITPSDKTEVLLSMYSANKTVPVTFKNNECVECAFVQENTDGKVISIHKLNEEGNYDIIVLETDKNDKIKSNYTIHTNEKYRWFSLIYPRITNFIDIDSPYPISIFATAIDTLKAIDVAFDSYNNEFLLGKKRTYVSAEMFEVDKETGEEKRVFDPDDVVVYRLPKATTLNGEEKPYVFNVTDSLRAAEHSQGIQDMLNFYSKQVGLGVDYYRFEKGRVMTATQVISEKSDTFRNLKKHEAVLEKALVSLLKALMYAYNEFVVDEEKFDKIDEVAVKFDDSIIEDKATEKSNDQKDVDMGIMSHKEYRAKWYGEEPDEAEKIVNRINGDLELSKRLERFSPFVTQGTITPLEFVKLVFIDITEESKQQELAEEIAERIKSGGEVFDFSNIYDPKKNNEEEK